MSRPQFSEPKVNRSCLECRRRKIRCDGIQPCRNCTWYQVQAGCQYLERKKRNLSTHNSIERLSIIRQTSAIGVLDKLFPGCPVESLAGLSRSELLQFSEHASPHQSGESVIDEQGAESDGQHEWNEPQEIEDPADDVNGLSLHLHRRSYMGISSIQAILRAILKLKPSIQRAIKMDAENNLSSPGPTHAMSPDTALQSLLPSIDERRALDAYFFHLHPVIPMIEEAEFRMQWERGNKLDRPWLALLNMVLAMGSISAGNPGDGSHHVYYMRAKPYLDLDLLGTGCLESLQALCLLGGCYLHYINSPNLAHTIMGAAYRIAIGLGLHREHTNTNPAPETLGSNRRPHIRRDIWWSLFCLDTWSSMTLGRPVGLRWDPQTMNVRRPYDGKSSDGTILSLGCSQEFCVIATRVQHRFAQLFPISITEILTFDEELQSWKQRLPPHFSNPNPPACPEHLLTAQFFMQNRYLNLRFLLYRPVLLNYANHRVSFSTLQPDEQNAVKNCQNIACLAIDQIVSVGESMNTLRIWNAVWYLYQASLVVLLSLIVDPADDDSHKWRCEIEKSLRLLEIMAPWARAADRSRQVLSSIYDACAVTLDGYSDAGTDVFGMTIWESLETFGEGWEWEPSMWLNDMSMG